MAGGAAIEPIPISALQHAVYCMRQAALIHLERQWADNRLTAEGELMHAVADRNEKRWSRGVRRVTALPLASQALNLVGKADLVEFHGGEDGAETPRPIEYKRGRPKKHRADEVQLCAQALCLEEMTGAVVWEGDLFYGEIRRRVTVAFDSALRELTERTAVNLAAVLLESRTPPPTEHRARCRACSLIELCRPDQYGRNVEQWRARQLDRVLADGADRADASP